MRSVGRALLLMSLVPLQVWAQNQNANATPSAEEEIKSLEQERNVAILNGGAAALDRMTADDYTFTTLRGELRTKSEVVKSFQSGSFKYESRQISDLTIRVYGDTAVVTGRSNRKGMENGKDYSGDYRICPSLCQAKRSLADGSVAGNGYQTVKTDDVRSQKPVPNEGSDY
jgi:ketosteroid isomerase-like protein